MRASGNESGFSYIDVMIAITILLVGVLTLGAALTGAVVTSGESEERVRAKQYSTSVLESVLAAQNMKIAGNAYDFDSLNYLGLPVSNPALGKFRSDRQALHETPGTDGLYGTADDDSTGGAVIPGYEMKITITDIGNDNPSTEKRIDVTVFYKVKNVERSDVISTIATRY